MADSTADEARKGLLGSFTGKVKEVAGAVTGNDSLAAEGQLQQAEAQARKDANAREAVAEVEAREAAQALAAERAEADRERSAVEAREAAQVSAAQTKAAAGGGGAAGGRAGGAGAPPGPPPTGPMVGLADRPRNVPRPSARDRLERPGGYASTGRSDGGLGGIVCR